MSLLSINRNNKKTADSIFYGDFREKLSHISKIIHYLESHLKKSKLIHFLFRKEAQRQQNHHSRLQIKQEPSYYPSKV